MKYLIILIMLGLMIGCMKQTIEPPKDVVKDVTYNAPFDAVWKALIEVLSTKELPIIHTEKESGILITDFVICGGKPYLLEISKTPGVFLAVWNEGRYKINAYVKALKEDQTNVRLSCHIEGYEMGWGHGGQWYVCDSKGVIEANIFSAIDTLLQK